MSTAVVSHGAFLNSLGLLLATGAGSPPGTQSLCCLFSDMVSCHETARDCCALPTAMVS